MVGGVVYHLIPGNALCCARTVLVGIVLEVCQYRVSAGNQDLRHTLERIAYVCEKFVPRAYAAGVLARQVHVFMHGVFFHMLCAKLQHLCSVVVNEGNGVKKWHTKSFCQCDGRLSARAFAVCGLSHA